LAALKPMLVASELLPIEGRPGQDDQVGPVQAAQQLFELEQARRHAGELASAMIGRLGGDRRLGKGGAETA